MQVIDERSSRSETRTVMRWVVAALLAFAALIGGFSLIAVFVWAAEDIPGWVTLALGGGLAIGTAAFAWIVASALRSKGSNE